MKKYEIWVGNYHLGQGSTPPTKPEKIGEEMAPSFNIACAFHEAKRHYENFVRQLSSGQINSQDCRFFYDFDTNTNSWLGKYYETEEEAQKTFRR